MPADAEPVLAASLYTGVYLMQQCSEYLVGNQSTAFNETAPLEPNRCSASTENLHTFESLNSLV
jgi:hypothetical protein